MVLNDIYLETIKQLKKDFIYDPSLEARLLIINILKIEDKLFISEKNNLKVSWFQKRKLNSYVKKRIKGKPIANILGSKHFYDIELFVNDKVLTPRPETELLIDVILKKIGNSSGVIPVSATQEIILVKQILQQDGILLDLNTFRDQEYSGLVM